MALRESAAGCAAKTPAAGTECASVLAAGIMVSRTTGTRTKMGAEVEAAARVAASGCAAAFVMVIGLVM